MLLLPRYVLYVGLKVIRRAIGKNNASSLGFVIYYFTMCLSIIVLLLTFVKPSTVLLYCQTRLTKQLHVILQVEDNLLRYLLFNCPSHSNVESIFYLGGTMFCLWS